MTTFRGILPAAFTPFDAMGLTEDAVQYSPAGKQVIVLAGAHTADAIALARCAVRAEAHIASALPPTGSDSFAEALP